MANDNDDEDFWGGPTRLQGLALDRAERKADYSRAWRRNLLIGASVVVLCLVIGYLMR